MSDFPSTRFMPAIGYITPNSQGWEATSNLLNMHKTKLESVDIKDSIRRENLAKFLGYIPIIGFVTGWHRLDSLAEHKYTTKHDVENKVWHVVRAIFEIIGLGIIYLLPDIFMTIKLARKPKQTPLQNNTGNNIPEPKPNVNVTKPKKSILKQTNQLRRHSFGTVLKFQEARAREFDKTKSPNVVGLTNSFTYEDLSNISLRSQFSKNSMETKLVSKSQSNHTQKTASLTIEDFTQTKQLERRYPPIGQTDTCIWEKGGGQRKSIHGQCSVFTDDEIINVNPTIKTESVSKFIKVEYTKNNRPIIQQQATRGCTAATGAMLIKQHGKAIDLTELQTRNLGNDEDILRDIRKAGLTPMVTELDKNKVYLAALKEVLEKNGSCIMGISDPRGGNHSIVVDAVSDDLKIITLRDPYHGWEIDVHAEAYLKRGQDMTCIQIASTP